MGTDAPFLSLVVPCYNEEGNLPALLEAFAAAVPPPGGFELIVVNNGSRDASGALLASLSPRYPFLRVVTVAVNRGYGYGITQGLLAARGLYAGWTHGDLQYPPAEVLRAAAALPPAPGETVFLKGLRSSRPAADLLFTCGMSVFESLLFLRPLRDINAQPTLFHRSLLQNWAGAPDGFLLDLFAFVRALGCGFRVLRVPVALKPRHAGASSWNRGLGAQLKLTAAYLAGSVRLRLGL